MSQPKVGLDRTKTGRAKGTPNKSTKAIKDMIEGALSAVGGQSYLEQQAIDNPNAFMTLIGKILPKQIDATLAGDPSRPLVSTIQLVAMTSCDNSKNPATR